MAQQENVIEVKFGRRKTDYISSKVQFPSSKNYFSTESLLDWESVLDAHDLKSQSTLSKTQDLKAKFEDKSLDISSKVLEQIKQIKLSSQRLKFYLDEL